MRWKTAKSGSAYVKEDDIIASVYGAADSDGWTLNIKVCQPFEYEDDARAAAQAIIEVLRDAELSRFTV